MLNPYNYDFSKEQFVQPPHHESVICLDAETSGLKPGIHGIVELGAIGQDYLGNELGRFHTFVNPGEHIQYDPEAMKVNGITMEDIANAPHMRDILPSFVDQLKKWYREEPWTDQDTGRSDVVPKTHLVGHNLQFDIDHLNAAADVYHPLLRKYLAKLARHKYDTQMHSPVYDKQRTLKGLGDLYGVQNTNPHRVIGDIEQTLGVYHQQRGQQRLAMRLISMELARHANPLNAFP